ncbi:protein of unknown function (DUF955) [Brevibacterium sp. 239c]|uniref:ImmA/IrrE family metallo-endopeptidase n=1 Tax=Brevibacterium sp. 239c TaxID=1965356 RepID=UPI000C52B901|nr:ImmA/IrrE family metallo-endopeptidase [Brevibacterium sp. 239c]SMY01422.1 protein of unknown function (DUF955) [Brevibacterium sp. 239c]
MKNLFALAESKGIKVQEVQLRAFRGFYVKEVKIIVVSSLLNTAQKRTTLAHELGHAHYGDEAVLDQPMHEWQERRADEWAAQFLIAPQQYAEAESLHGPHPGAIAQHLNVTRELTEVWQTLIRKAA